MECDNPKHTHIRPSDAWDVRTAPKEIGGFAIAFTSEIINSYWRKEGNKPQKFTTRNTVTHRATTSWIDKLRVAHMIQRTRNEWNIHHTLRQYAQDALAIW